MLNELLNEISKLSKQEILRKYKKLYEANLEIIHDYNKLLKENERLQEQIELLSRFEMR